MKRIGTLRKQRVSSTTVCRDVARGFSLIELVISLAIVAILASIAFPGYQAYLRNSSRAEAQSLITNAATMQQQYLVDRRSYATTMTELGMKVPDDLLAKYTFAIAVTDGPPPTYTLTATAIGDQVHDKCPTLTLNNIGNRTPSTCW